MLRVAESAHRSDTGRQRGANEDSYFARAPVFAVADGMGGAQAGEVASSLAAAAFEPGNADDEAPETYLRRVAVEANTRIHELSREDSSRSGMGTTLTAALIAGEEVSLGHVGDSRAYVFRDRELKRLTSDHSLVEELRRQGRLTEQQAEEHPQRSIITRALGPEPQVEVDTMTIPARPGDVFVICSDGLTTMLSEQRIQEVLSEAASLDDAATQLVNDANEAGGRDNITVVLFRLEEVGAPADADHEDPTLIGPAAEEAGFTAEAVRAASGREAAGAEAGAAVAEPRGRWPRKLVWGTVVGLIVVAIAAAAFFGARQVYFLGTDEGGRLALYRGLPYELPFGIELYSEQYSTPVQVSSLPEERQSTATDHTLRSRDDAVSLLEDLENAAETESVQPAPEPVEGGTGQTSGSGSTGTDAKQESNGQGPAGGPSPPEGTEKPPDSSQ